MGEYAAGIYNDGAEEIDGASVGKRDGANAGVSIGEFVVANAGVAVGDNILGFSIVGEFVGANVDTDGEIKLDGKVVGELILDISLYIIKRKIYSFF